MSNHCPICGGSGCTTYPLMVDRYHAGRDRGHWRQVHDRMNGRAEYPPPPRSAPRLPIVATDLRAFRACPYASDFVAGCCSAPATVRCHWKAATVTLSTCVQCINEMT